MRPHHSRYRLNPNHENEDEFVETTKEISETYHEAPDAALNGRRTVSTDENTGIQALERRYPSKTMVPGKPERIEFEYIRHGTLSLIASFDIVTGRVLSPCTGETRNEQDFREHIQKVVSSDPRAKERVFVADQLNTHKSESLVGFVAEFCELEGDLGVKGKSGILRSMESGADFLKDKTHSIRFVYTPKHLFAAESD